MKKALIQTILVFTLVVILLPSCKKKKVVDPINPPSTSVTAPTLNTGVNTSLNTTNASANATVLYLNDIVTDPQGDTWTVTSVTSSNPAVASIEIASAGVNWGFKYTGVSVGSATFTIVVTDVNGNANTITYSITITQSPNNNTNNPNAPLLNSNINKSLSVEAGSNVFWNLSDKVTDSQNDTWTITSVLSSNTSVLGVSIDGTQIVNYVGVGVGNATMTVTLSDASNNTNTFTASVTVSPKYVGPPK